MTISVYGLGRFGAFWARTLASHFPQDRVVGASRSSPAPPGVSPVSPQEAARADTLFLCSSISSLREVLNSLRPHLGEETLVVDTCSVKAWPVQVMQEVLGPQRPLLATHPMFGPDSARDGVRGLPIVVYPVGGEHPLQVEWSRRFEAMGLRVLTMSPEEHDRAAAFTQGVTHLVGRILHAMGLEPHPMATLGFRGLLEIMNQTCNDPWQLFLDLQRFNPHTEAMRQRFLEAVERVLAAIEGSP